MVTAYALDTDAYRLTIENVYVYPSRARNRNFGFAVRVASILDNLNIY